MEPGVDPESLTSSCCLQSKREMIPELQMLGSLKRLREDGASRRGPTTGGVGGENPTYNSCEVLIVGQSCVRRSRSVHRVGWMSKHDTHAQ